MDFHGINMQGYFKTGSVVDASALLWTANDEATIVYDETTKDLWLADDTEWKIAGQYVDTPLGTEMWIYADSAPDGWTISAGSDDLIAVKGGAYATGGTVDGDWATPIHSHTLGGHGHTTLATNTYGYNGTILGGRSAGEGNELVIYTHQHSVPSVVLGTPTPPSTMTNGSVSTYRPESRVGLICERT